MPLELRTSGSASRRTPNRSSSSPSQARFAMSYSMVRDALVWSVAKLWPLVSRNSSQVSIVPNTASPDATRRARPGTCCSIHSIFVAEK